MGGPVFKKFVEFSSRIAKRQESFMKNSSPKKIRHNLLLAGLSNSNSGIMDQKVQHPLLKVFRTLLSLLFIGGLTYLFIFHR